MSETPRLRWFEQFPKCPCGKAAQGVLRGEGNESYGYHCQNCANRRLRASEKIRADEARAAIALTQPPAKAGEAKQ